MHAGVLQLEELLLDEPDNQDYQSLYNDVQEVRTFQMLLPLACKPCQMILWGCRKGAAFTPSAWQSMAAILCLLV